MPLSFFGLGSGVFIVNISSDILLGSGVLLIGLSTISLCTQKIISKFQNKIPLEKKYFQAIGDKITEFDISDEKITEKTFIQTLDKYLEKFNPLNKKYIGKIAKIDLENDSKLVLKADIHGDFESLKKHLQTLQKNGCLDENFNVKEEYKDKVVIAFLGDYIDRGENGFKVLNLLLKLKMQNPNEVVLLRKCKKIN